MVGARGAMWSHVGFTRTKSPGVSDCGTGRRAPRARSDRGVVVADDVEEVVVVRACGSRTRGVEKSDLLGDVDELVGDLVRRDGELTNLAHHDFAVLGDQVRG